MFTGRELELLKEMTKQKIADTTAGPDPEWMKIQGKLLGIDRYDIQLKCHQCWEWEQWNEFENDHRCKHCGERLCDSCYDDIPFCDGKCHGEFLKGEAADYFHELYHDG